MRIGFFGGLHVLGDSGREIVGARTRGLLFRLAIDAGTVVSTRSLIDDLWPDVPPLNAKAALQSVVSRLRAQLPEGTIASTSSGYRLEVPRSAVDVLVFQDLVSAAENSSGSGVAELASSALAVWTGEPWAPDDAAWYVDELLADRQRALALGGVVPAPAASAREFRAAPAPLTPLVGRHAELALVSSQLATSRLVTIVGAGGAGKTRLATEAIQNLGAVVFVPLAPVGPDEVTAAILGAVGRDIRASDVSAEPMRDRDRVLDALGARDTTLVLDNCEHLIAAAADVTRDLLEALPSLRVVATSREPLGLVGEAFVRLGPLAHSTLAELDAGVDTQVLGQTAAVQLFGQRAVAARGVELDEAEILTAARICARLDGLALAIELAAARLRTLTLDEIAAGLDDRFTLLDGAARHDRPRHQTLRALIDWSWDLLGETERAALCAVAVFPSGIAVTESAGALAALGIEAPGILDSLVDKSLVQRSGGRFRTLETIREYGIDRLSASGELDRLRLAFTRLMAERAAWFDRRLRGPQLPTALDWFDAEEDNLTAARRYAVDTGEGELAIEIVASISWYGVIRDRNTDVFTWMSDVVDFIPGLDTPAALLVSVVQMVTTAFAGTVGPEDLSAETAAPAAREVLAKLATIPEVGSGDLLETVVPLLRTYATALESGDWPVAVSIPRGEELGLGEWPTALLHVMRAATSDNSGNIAELGEASALAVEQFGRIGDPWGLALARQMQSGWLNVVGRLDEALAMSDASTAGLRDITSPHDLMQQQALSVAILQRMGRLADAEARAAELVESAESSGTSRAVLQAWFTAGNLAASLGKTDEASRFLRQIDGIRNEPAGLPLQIVAMVEVLRGRIAGLRGDSESARSALNAALEVAARSNDQPVIAFVGYSIAESALRFADSAVARNALVLAATVRGRVDAFDPQVLDVLAATGETADDLAVAVAEPTMPVSKAIAGLGILVAAG